MTKRSKMSAFKKKALKNPDVRAEYDALSSAFQMKRQMIVLRHKAGLTQKQMAELLGTKKSNISRLLVTRSKLSSSRQNVDAFTPLENCGNRKQPVLSTS